MQFLRTCSIILFCLGFLGSNVANAAVPCCMMGGHNAPPAQNAAQNIAPSKAQDKAHAGSAMEMPCHQMADETSPEAACCDSCDCQHSIPMSLLPAAVDAEQNPMQSVRHSDRLILYSKQPYALFHPPRFFS